jgi:dTMP kinase
VGVFLSFEGGEGTGKSTQILRLAETLRSENFVVRTTREPGGTVEGNVIRELLVSGDTDRWSRNSEMLLNFAAREIHLNRVIRPALASNEVVITDRFLDSTFVYQCFAGGADIELFKKLADLIVGNTMPDLTFILDIDPSVGILRSRNRMANLKIASEQLAEKGYSNGDIDTVRSAMDVETMANEDRFERMNLGFHNKVREGFLLIASGRPERCARIDASGSIETVALEIREVLKTRVREHSKRHV